MEKAKRTQREKYGEKSACVRHETEKGRETKKRRGFLKLERKRECEKRRREKEKDDAVEVSCAEPSTE